MKSFVTIILTALVTNSLCKPSLSPHVYNPFANLFKFPIPYYHNAAESFVPVSVDDIFKDDVLVSYLSQPNDLPTMNVLTGTPFLIQNRFNVVPMLLVSQENMNFVEGAKIMGTSDRKPLMIVKTEHNSLLQCTPAVKIELEHPIIVFSLKTSIVFPSEIDIVYEGYRIPIKVGAVMAPIPQDTFVSTETPVSINVIYAVPTKPVHVDTINNGGNSVTEDEVSHSGNDSGHELTSDIGPIIDNDNDDDNQAVVVDSSSPTAPLQQNITVLTFPEVEGEPQLQVDEEDAELVNRNPPLVLAPAGIVQSTQPHASVEPFTNSKDSPVLHELIEEAAKQRL